MTNYDKELERRKQEWLAQQDREDKIQYIIKNFKDLERKVSRLEKSLSKVRRAGNKVEGGLR